MRPELPATGQGRRMLYLLGLLSALRAAAIAVLAESIAVSVVSVIAGDGRWQRAVVYGAMAVVLRSLLAWAQQTTARRTAAGVKEELRSELLERLTGESRQSTAGEGDVSVLATRSLDAVDNYYTSFLPALVSAATVPLILGARILSVDWLSALIIVLTVPLIPLFMVLIGWHTQDKVQQASDSLARLSNHLVELAKGLPVLVGLGRAGAQTQALRRVSEDYRTRTLATLRVAFLSALALELIATLSVAVVAVFIGVRLVHGELSLQVGLLALILAPECYAPLREVGAAFHASEDGVAAVRRVRGLLDAPRSIPLVGPRADGGRIDDGGTAVVVEDLTVSYANRSAPALDGLTFAAPAGQVTALTGPSGCGKSTALDVLAGLLGSSGSVTVGGRVRGPRPGLTAWVPQHPATIAPTVREEVLLYAWPLSGSAAEEVVRRSLRDVGAGHLAERHPAELSPGELRRVAVARALVRVDAGAKVVLLDEPTAHLDAGTAGMVEQAVGALRGRATVILVAHDPATIALADKVVQVGGGAQDAGTPEPAGRPNETDVPALHGNEDQDRNEVQHRRRRREPAPADRASAFAALLHALRPSAPRFLLAVLFGVLASLFAVTLAALSGWLIVRASEQPPILYLLTAIVGVRFFGIGRALLRYLERLWLHDAVFSAMVQLRVDVWNSLAARGLSARRLLRGDRTVEHLVGDVDALRDLAPRVVLPPVTGLLTAAGALIATAFLLPEAFGAQMVVVAGGLLLAPLVAVFADRAASRAELRLRSIVLRSLAGVLAAAADLRANGVDAPVREQVGRSDRAATAAVQRAAWAQGLAQAILLLATGLGALLTVTAAAGGVAAGQVPGAVVAAVVMMDLALAEALAGVVPAVQLWPALSNAAGRFAGELGPRVDAQDTVRSLSSEPLPEGKIKSLSLEAVAIRWSGMRSRAFEGVNAEVTTPGWLAVSGPSGSGKSTLLALLLGFLPAEHGTYRVNGHRIDMPSAAELRGRVAWCPQEAHLFDSSVRANLLLARPAGHAPSDDELLAVLERVGLADTVASMGGGLDSRIGAGGAFLSGGQRQRLAVARTLLVGADVVLLDEPTAHLDVPSATELMADLRRALEDRIVVLVSHAAHDIEDSDCRLELTAAAGPSRALANAVG